MRLVLVIFTILFSGNAIAFQNYFTNVFRPYPGGCATNIQIASLFPTRVVVIAQGTIQLYNQFFEEHDVDVLIERRLCTESNRAIIQITYTVPDNNDGLPDLVFLPMHRGDVNGTVYNLRALREPNQYFSAADLSQLGEGAAVTLILDTWSIFAANYGQEREMTPNEYNGAFTLQLVRVGITDFIFTADIPALDDSSRPTRMALNGRLSGTWVIHGVEDQGFVIAFQELADQFNPFLFFSWYTFDQNNKLIWLTGGDTFEIGDTSITFDIVHVTNGDFMGFRRADREIVGSVTLTGINCNHLRLRYDLSGLGMGSATRKLERLFELETQGYTCRDSQSRIMSLNAGGGLE